MNNPLAPFYKESNDLALVSKSLEGDRTALDSLIRLHQPFIYNVAWKMTNDEDDALDLTQEVLLKVISKLSTFKGKSSLRTWLYRIVVTEFLQTKRKAKEDQFESFDDFSTQLNSIPNPELTAEEEIEQDHRTKTARFRCMSGMLMCLTREQRLMYILGDIFKIDHIIGAEIFNLSKENYRVRLSRTRKEFHAFMNNQCGLVNTENPCRCSKKAKAMEAAGRMCTNEKLFDKTYYATISKYAESVADEVADLIDRKYIEFYRSHPSKSDFGAETIISEIINDKEISDLLN
jgi:RNA polymerase sigma factor (sigma-70 family)